MTVDNESSASTRLAMLGIELPPVSSPAANYANAVRTGNLLFLSGKVPQLFEGRAAKGRLGAEFDSKCGYELARSACIELLAVVRSELGSLDKVRRVVEVQGFLNATPEFVDHAAVLDGASDLLVEVFAEKGVHARSVLGASSLRNGLPVVLRAVVEIED